LKGLETLAVRVERQTQTAGKVSDALAGHAKINRLIYPGRADHPQAEIIKKQMKSGSTLLAFDIKGGKEGAFRFLNGLSLIGITNNLGDAKSLITHPTTTTHQRLTPDQRAELDIGDGLVRLSCGLEHADDVIEDLLAALDKV
jgi:O-succinylhomoserine sulfhydrylase